MIEMSFKSNHVFNDTDSFNARFNVSHIRYIFNMIFVIIFIIKNKFFNFLKCLDYV